MVVVILLAITLTGCRTTYTTDYLDKYKDYLKYSLNDYTVVSEETHTVNQTPVPVITTSTSWTLEYVNKNGDTNQFNFANYGHAGGGDDENMGYAVYQHACQLAVKQLNKDIFLKYFPGNEVDGDALENETGIKINISLSRRNVDGYPKYIDTETGIRFYSFSAYDFISESNLSYYLYCYTYNKNEEEIELIKANMENVVNDIYASTESVPKNDVTLYLYSDISSTERFYAEYDPSLQKLIFESEISETGEPESDTSESNSFS